MEEVDELRDFLLAQIYRGQRIRRRDGRDRSRIILDLAILFVQVFPGRQDRLAMTVVHGDSL